MISKRDTSLSILCLGLTLCLAACAVPQTPAGGALSPTQAQRLVDRQQELAEQLAEIRGELDEVHATLQEQGATLSELERSGVRPAEGAAREEPSAAATALDLSPTEVYRKSFAAYASGNFAQAIEGFELFVENFPDSKYAGNAYYWLGESYFSRQDYPRAITAFRALAEQFPESTKVPEGLFRVAQSYVQMDQPEQAKQVIEILRERYPKSSAARRTLEIANP